MSALHAHRMAERSGAIAEFPAYAAPSSGWDRHGAGEPPAIALVKEHLNSSVVAAVLLVSVVAHGRSIGGPELALAALAYAAAFKFVTRPRLDRADGDADWARVLRHRLIEWACVAGLLVLAGRLLGLLFRLLVAGGGAGGSDRDRGRQAERCERAEPGRANELTCHEDPPW